MLSLMNLIYLSATFILRLYAIYQRSMVVATIFSGLLAAELGVKIVSVQQLYAYWSLILDAMSVVGIHLWDIFATPTRFATFRLASSLKLIETRC